MNIEDIHINPNNPRYIRDERYQKLKKSIQEFPKMMKLRPIIIDDTGMILGGNMRYLVMVDLGYKEIPEGWVAKASELTEEERKRFIAVDNVPFGDFDYDKLANEWDLKELQDWGMEFPEMEEIIEADERDDKIPELPEEPKSKIGDLYQLGDHRLLCGNATKKEDVERLMDGKKEDMVFTDPPYGIGYQDLKKRFNKIINDKESDIPKILKSIIRWEHIPYYICCNWQSYPLFFMILKDLIDIKAVIVWDKKRGVQNLDKYYKRHEFILYSGAFGGERTIDGDIWELNREISELHPTQKPVELCSKAIIYSSEKVMIVSDLFGGSGSTLIACEKLNRRCYMMEIDPIYIDVIIERWENYTGKKAVR
ncbi:hypothetical protein ES705_43470 [subsurface metagenome]